MPRNPMAVLAVVALTGALLALRGPAHAAPRVEEGHRALRAALYHLKEAREEVKDERFKRHRERVEKDLKVAIVEVERALKEGRIEAKFEPARGWDEKYRSFKHLRQAVVELDIAKKELREERAPWARRKELVQAIEDAHAHAEDALKELK